MILAALLHVSVTSAVFLVGKSGLAPSQFSSTGLGTFASDGFAYQDEITQLPEVLEKDGIKAWATWPTQLHVRIYSLPLIVLHRWVAFNVLTIEPINLIYYLAIVVLVFEIGKTAFDHRVGFLAAVVVGLWPSLLLHTTQLLRDPLLIAAFLAFIMASVRFLARDQSPRKLLIWGVVGAVAILIIRIVRLPMWTMLWAIIGVALSLMAIRFIRERRIQFLKLGFIAIVLVAMVLTSYIRPTFQQNVATKQVLVPEELQRLSMSEQIARRRAAFGLQINKEGEVEPSQAGSDLGNEVHFSRVTDIIRYLPRALEVGFLAPFPNMWWSQGKQVGSSGRVFAGLEMALTYFLFGLAAIGVWGRRKHLQPWFLVLSAAAGMAALGLIVTNIGTLYRLRYPFWILIVLLSATGAIHLISRDRARLQDVD